MSIIIQGQEKHNVMLLAEALCQVLHTQLTLLANKIHPSIHPTSGRQCALSTGIILNEIVSLYEETGKIIGVPEGGMVEGMSATSTKAVTRFCERFSANVENLQQCLTLIRHATADGRTDDQTYEILRTKVVHLLRITALMTSATSSFAIQHVLPYKVHHDLKAQGLTTGELIFIGFPEKGKLTFQKGNPTGSSLLFGRGATLLAMSTWGKWLNDTRAEGDAELRFTVQAYSPLIPFTKTKEECLKYVKAIYQGNIASVPSWRQEK